MGEQTCAVLVGFVVLHVALVLSIVSLSTPVWIKATENSTVPINSTENVTTKGLWEICEFGECQKLNQTLQSASFRASQVLFTVGVALVGLGALGMYTYLSLQQLRASLKVSVLSLLNLMLASFCFLTSIIVYGLKAMNDNADLESDLVTELGWSFYMGIAATVFSFISTMAAVGRTRKIGSINRGYQDL